jgi:ankyrin repeat protein
VSHGDSEPAADELRLLVEDALSGNPASAAQRLAKRPDLVHESIVAAAVAGESAAVSNALNRDSEAASRVLGPNAWEPLLYVCYSRLQHAPTERSEAFAKTARCLLDHGADPNAFFTVSDDPNARQTALYGACGINNNPELTRALLQAGADPNDAAPGYGPESLYHASERDDLRCLRLLLEASPHRDKVNYCFARKLDFEDYEGARLYLEHGADSNFKTPFGDLNTRLHHAVQRRRGAQIVELLLRHGADVGVPNAHGVTPYALAVRLGQSDSAKAMERHGADPAGLGARDRFLGACSLGRADDVRSFVREHPGLVASLGESERVVLPEAAMDDRLEAVRVMLEAGLDVHAVDHDRMTALHWAGWNGNLAIARLLLDHGAPLECENVWGGTVLDGTVWAVGHSESRVDRLPVIAALLEAGADADAVVPFPSGHAEVDALLAGYRRA